MPNTFIEKPLDPLAVSLAHIWMSGDKTMVHRTLRELIPGQAMVMVGLIATHLSCMEPDTGYKTFIHEIVAPMYADGPEGS